MPKKFKGENSKAVEARARKNAVQTEKQEELRRKKEDEEWKDDDKHVLKKQNRKEDRDRKKQEVNERKAQNRQLAEEEMTAVVASAATNAPKKVTHAQLAMVKERQQLEQEEANRVEKLKAQRIVEGDDEAPIEQNVNRLNIDTEIATNVDQAINLLDESAPEVEKNPEKRMKAAFLAFEETRLPILKKENPTLRLSQLKQLLKKEWMKSPQNPLVAALLD